VRFKLPIAFAYNGLRAAASAGGLYFRHAARAKQQLTPR
jgi:hypothetical protein